VDAHHRGLDAHTADERLEATVHVSVADERHVSRGAAHVEAERPLEAAERGDAGGAHHAAGGPREQGIGTAKALHVGQASRGLHETQARARQLALQRRHVRTQQRREVGVHSRRLAARQQPHLARNLVGGDDMGETHLERQVAKARLRLRVGVGVDQRDGRGLDSGGARLRERCPGARLVEGFDLLAVGADAPVDLHHPRVQRRRLADPELEQLRPLLGADLDQVAQAAIRHEHGRSPPAFEQRVGRQRGAEAHAAARKGCARWNRTGPLQYQSDAIDGCSVRGEDLRGVERAVGRRADAIGEGAAAVDREPPESVVSHAVVGGGAGAVSGLRASLHLREAKPPEWRRS
jgi:hypothetical protein